MGKYSKVDAAKDTKSSTSQVSRAHHDARTHSSVRSGRDSGHFKSPPKWADGKTKSGISLFPKR